MGDLVSLDVCGVSAENEQFFNVSHIPALNNYTVDTIHY